MPRLAPENGCSRVPAASAALALWPDAAELAAAALPAIPARGVARDDKVVHQLQNQSAPSSASAAVQQRDGIPCVAERCEEEKDVQAKPYVVHRDVGRLLCQIAAVQANSFPCEPRHDPPLDVERKSSVDQRDNGEDGARHLGVL